MRATAARITSHASKARALRSTVFFIIPALTLLSGCGLKTEAQWEDAPGAQQFFSNSASQEALRERDVGSLELGCEALIPAAKKATTEPGGAGLRVLIQACSQEGLGFGDDLRCSGDTLQVRCL